MTKERLDPSGSDLGNSPVRAALEHAQNETASLRRHAGSLETQVAKLATRLDEALEDNERLRRQIHIYERSSSWRMTSPLRAARRAAERFARRARAFLTFHDQVADGAKAIRDTPASPVDRRLAVLVSHDADLYGAELIALNLVRTLTTRLHYRIEVILCGPGPLKPEFEAISRVHDFSSLVLTRTEKLAVLRELYERGARLAFCNTCVVGEVAELLKTTGFTVVSMIHELPGIIRTLGLGTSARQIAAHTDHLVFPAPLVRDGFKTVAGTTDAKLVVQPQGLLTPNRWLGRRDAAREHVRATLGIASHARIVLGVGHADHRKGIDLFIEAGLRVLDRDEDVRFVWVGRQEPAVCEPALARLRRSGKFDSFRFLPPIRDPYAFFAGADVYAMTSREDPFPSVVLEALDAALPVVGFEGAGGFVDLLKRGCGVVVPIGDVRAMADEILRLLRTPADAAAMARVARGILAREFSFVNYARRLVELGEQATPSVSVIVPNYNYARYLPARLQSIINQTFPPHEVIFLDDGSTDGSVEIAAEMLHGSGLAYRMVVNDANQGTYHQWLKGLRESTGDLVWIAEADDDCAPEFLERMVAQFSNPDVVLAYCQSRQIDENGREIAPDYLTYTAIVSATKWLETYVRSGVDEIRDSLAVKNTIPNVSAVLMRRLDLSGIEAQLLSLRNTGDYLVYVHALEHGSVAFVADSLNAHRRHAGSVTSFRGGLNLMRELLVVQQYVADRHGITSATRERREAERQLSYEYLGLHTDGPTAYTDHPDLKLDSLVSDGS
jgi:glycosyltransferase involved in cell wall biosynthesis